MTLLMKVDFLRPLLVKHLQRKESFPTELPRCGQALQIIQFTSFREKGESWKSIWGVISDKYSHIACEFTADCCNEFEGMAGRRLTEIKGALIFVEKWELNVIPSQKSNTLKAVVKIDLLRLFGDEGEAMIGDPREFNTYKDVKDALTDPQRKAIYFGHPAERREYSSQEQEYSSEQTSQFESQAVPLQQSKRRKLNKEEPPGWKEMKSISHKDYQISPGQQGMLDSDATWFTPHNLHQYQTGPETDEAPVVVATTAIIDQDHPPLSSPEPSSQAIQRDHSQFHTQAPPVMDESQFRRKQNESKNPEVTEDYEWEATPPVAKEKQTARAQSPTALDVESETLEWELTPPRPAKTIQKNTPPLDNDEEMERDESPASQAPIGDDPPSSPFHGEVLFQEDSQRERREFSDENELPASMNVSTAELLTQEQTDVEEEKILKVVEVSKIIVQEPLESVDEEVNMEVVEEVQVDGRQVEEMEDVQPSVPTQKERSISLVENSFETEKSMEQPTPLPRAKEVVQSTVLQSQTLFSTPQDKSASTQYPNSTPSNPPQPTQDDSHQSKLSSTKSLKPTSPISSTQTPIIPQPLSFPPQRNFSPPHQQPSQTYLPKPTPATTSAPASAQIQVKETPLPGQRPAQQAPISLTSPTTRISATAPSPAKGPAEPILQRRYKRDRHVGPIIPRFSRRERRMNYDLEVILLEDRKEFGAQKGDGVLDGMQVDRHGEEVVGESFESEKPGEIETEIPVQEVENASRGNAVMEEIIEASFKTDSPGRVESETRMGEVWNSREAAPFKQGIVTESVENETLKAMDPQKPRHGVQTAMEGDDEEILLKETVKNNLEMEPLQATEQTEEIKTRVKNVNVPPLKPQLDDTQDDSQTFDAAQSRWGRFTAHWRRFSSS